MDISGNKRDSSDIRIKKVVSKMSRLWFKNVRIAFLKKCDIGKDYIEYDFTPPENAYIFDFKTPDERDKFLENLANEGLHIDSHDFVFTRVTLEKYCYYIRYSEYKDGCGEYFANNIIELIDEIIANANPDVKVISALIQHINKIIKEEIEDLLIYFNDPGYENVLKYFQEECRKAIHNKFHDKVEAMKLVQALVHGGKDGRINDFKVEKQESVKKVSQVPKIEQQYIDDVFLILSPYFEETQREDLERVLRTGNIENGPLLFKGSGSALCFFFKQLLKYHIIVITPKSILHHWLSTNFEYIHGGKKKELTADYAGIYISETKRKVPSISQLAKFSYNQNKSVDIQPLPAESRAKNLNS